MPNKQIQRGIHGESQAFRPGASCHVRRPHQMPRSAQAGDIMPCRRTRIGCAVRPAVRTTRPVQKRWPSRSIGPSGHALPASRLTMKTLAQVAADHAVAAQLVDGQKRHVRGVGQAVPRSTVEPRVVSHGKREGLASCPILRLVQQRGTDALPPRRRRDAKINDPENVHDGLADADRPEIHPHMSHETAAAPGQKTPMRDLLEKGTSPMRAAEACIKQAGDGRVQGRVRRIGE